MTFVPIGDLNEGSRGAELAVWDAGMMEKILLPFLSYPCVLCATHLFLWSGVSVLRFVMMDGWICYSMDESGSPLSTKGSLCYMWPAFFLSRHWFQLKSVPPLGRNILRDRDMQCLQFHLSIFASDAHVLSVLVKQSVLIPMSRISLTVSARSFRTSAYTLKHLVHSCLILLCGVR